MIKAKHHVVKNSLGGLFIKIKNCKMQLLKKTLKKKTA